MPHSEAPTHMAQYLTLSPEERGEYCSQRSTDSGRRPPPQFLAVGLLYPLSPKPRILLHPCSLFSKVLGPRSVPTPQSHPTATAFKIVTSLLSMPIPAAAHQGLLSPKLGQ